MNPIINNKIPNFTLALVNTILLFNKGINSFALKIGPAINCGK